MLRKKPNHMDRSKWRYCCFREGSDLFFFGYYFEPRDLSGVRDIPSGSSQKTPGPPGWRCHANWSDLSNPFNPPNPNIL